MKFEWGYMRKGWLSCKKAGLAFSDHESELEVEINAKSQPIKGEEGWNLVQNADHIFIASGKKILEFRPTAANRDEIMKKILGRTGNLRAPTIRKGNSFFIGFNEDMYSQVLFT